MAHGNIVFVIIIVIFYLLVVPINLSLLVCYNEKIINIRMYYESFRKKKRSEAFLKSRPIGTPELLYHVFGTSIPW